MGNLKETEVIKLYGVFESLGESLKYEDRLLKNAKVVILYLRYLHHINFHMKILYIVTFAIHKII